MRITVENVELWRQMAEAMRNIYADGVVYATCDKENITWKVASDVFDVPAFKVGGALRKGGAGWECMQTGKMAVEKVPREVFGMRLLMFAHPVWDGDEAVGSVIVGVPRMHPIAQSFNYFAPQLADLFSEGAVLYATDLTQFAYVAQSKKFQIDRIQKGVPLKEGLMAYNSIKTKQVTTGEFDAGVYGVPTQGMNFPFFDLDDSSQVVGTFGIILPRVIQLQLREMSGNLGNNLSEISAVIEELAASASDISSSEQQLNENVNEILHLSEEINGVLAFIKQIADETKMLGLNAAIEAARAGDAGRGFGVVAEEIRKLSDESKDTVSKIHGLTGSIKDKIAETIKKSDIALRSSEEQAAATEEITASIEEITAMAEQLDKIAKDI